MARMNLWRRIAFILAGSVCAHAAEPLASVRAIRSLSAEERELSLPVRLDVVVTFYHEAWGVLFVHDGGDGICVGVPEAMRPQVPFKPGTKLHVEGAAGAGEFLPVVLPSKLESRGTAELPEYQRVSAEELFVPAMDCHPVEVRGIVRGTSFSDESLVVDLQADGWMLKTVVSQRETLAQLPWQLVGRRVRVRGIAGTHFNDQRQMSGRLLYVADVESLVLDEESKPVGDVPLARVDGLLRVDSPLRQRVRVRGVVTHVSDGSGIYLRGEGGSMFVQTAQQVAVRRGDEVEAEGYPLITPFRPSLSAIDVKKTGEAETPRPIAMHAAQTRNSREQCELVTLDGDFVEMMHGREGASVVCRSEGQVFEAVLANGRLPEMDAGMKLRLAGVCEFSTTHPLVIPRNATGFRIYLRDADDVTVLARGPWWTESRARWMLGGLLLLAMAVGAWALTLQMVVRSQSSVIRQQAEQQAKLEERQRIASDLHDTLEQELVGVNMLLDTTAIRLNGSHAQADEPLSLARKLLRRAREESRSTIRELRSVTLEQRGLPAALDELLRPLATAGGAKFEVKVSGSPERLAGTLETHLLRIAQEAVANAAQHAAARHITISLGYADDTVGVEVRDDGHGFDVSTPVQAGHFGLGGMKERADKIGGQLRIKSMPGAGTVVTVSAPAQPLKRPAISTTP